MSDGAVHGLYAKWSEVKDKLLKEIKDQLASMTEKFITKESHQEKLCIGTTDDEICLTKDQVKDIIKQLPTPQPTPEGRPQGTAPTPSPSPSPSPEPTPTPSPTPIATESALTTP
jgi:hypothetical protein